MTQRESVAVIPARGGSVRIPRKNVRLLGGRPLVAWTITAACDAHAVDRVVVSTEDAAIAEIAAGLGVEVVQRPVDLADQATPAVAVVVDACQTLEQRGTAIGVVCMLLPTSPFRTAADIDEAFAVWEKVNAQERHGGTPSIVSVTDRMGLMRTLRHIDAAGVLCPLDPQLRLVESNGAIQIMAWEDLRSTASFHARAFPFALGEANGLDLDTEVDWAVAESIAQSRARAHGHEGRA